MEQILKEHRLDFIGRTIQKFNIAETEQRYGKPTCMKYYCKRIKNYTNVCHWKYENMIDAETKEANNIYIWYYSDTEFLTKMISMKVLVWMN